ncbi:hypothetical protein CkaCkLH20_02408 [Colletotrichum karsti]|uniref:Cyanovirin-N domain-containing protein n=1 Tax=Colletotrichum karsti TaxID=1095194 RepID=A0A9P6LLI1_9PEZI|nr:uncharacterized protein CkaCkLH20_02408 [Colletotrichum karsti]KAF9880454.1 hypothetical protein CkaCkLH20_02408 [Colletotrichum karsti]
MKFATVFALFATSAIAADFGKTCRDEHIDAATEVLSARCDTGDGKGTLKDTSLNLNDCFGYRDNKIQAVNQGHFGDVCSDCFAYRLPDPIYEVFGVFRVWMNCTCGSPTESTINLDKTKVTNKFGDLVCA